MPAVDIPAALEEIEVLRAEIAELRARGRGAKRDGTAKEQGEVEALIA